MQHGGYPLYSLPYNCSPPLPQPLKSRMQGEKKSKKETDLKKYPTRTDRQWKRSMQLKKAACARSQTFLQLQASSELSRRAGPLPAPALGRGSARELLMSEGETGVVALSVQGDEIGFPRSCLCSEISHFLCLCALDRLC